MDCVQTFWFMFRRMIATLFVVCAILVNADTFTVCQGWPINETALLYELDGLTATASPVMGQ